MILLTLAWRVPVDSWLGECILDGLLCAIFEELDGYGAILGPRRPASENVILDDALDGH